MAHETKAAIRIGISGWTYASWRGVFYPDDLPQKQELAFAARAFPSLEINGTFYSQQSPASFGRWAEAVPEDFVFAVKGPRFITHMLRLKHPEAALANFFASGLLRLGPALGPLLWQLPPQFRFDAERLEDFFRLLPKNTTEAAELARHHDHRLKARGWLRTDAERPIRHAVEIRHDSFLDPAFPALLRRHGVALVCADTVDWPRVMDPTADFVYCRLHGSEELYASGYGEADLDLWAARVAAWALGRKPPDSRYIDEAAAEVKPRPVFLYFDNDAKQRAPVDARHLIERLERHLGTPLY